MPPMNSVANSRAKRISLQSAVRRRHTPGYSRFVGTMKLVLPTVAFFLIILIVAWPYLRTQDNRFRLGFTEMGLGGKEAPAMLNPRYLGTDENAQPYSITADIAKNLLKEDASVELDMPKADITLEDGSWLVLTAENGIYGRKEKTMELVGAVNLFHDSGYEFSTARAHIDLNSGMAYGESPIEGQGPFGDLKAEGFRLINKGSTIHFTGKAKLVIYPSAGRQTGEGG